MIGKKKLSTIRAEIGEALAKDDFDAERWFRAQVRKLERRKSSDPQDLVGLALVRQALADAAKEAAPKKGRRRATSR